MFPPILPELHQAGGCGYPVEPRAHRRFSAEFVKIPVSGDESLLRGIFRIRLIAEDAVGHVVYKATILLDDALKVLVDLASHIYVLIISGRTLSLPPTSKETRALTEYILKYCSAEGERLK